MNVIELERWKPSEADPRRLEYAGQRVAQEVFEELKHRLVGMRPLRMSDCDKTVLAIQDGELNAFKELYPKALNHADNLLIEAAGRPGVVGRQMTLLLLESGSQFSDTAYRTACQKAIDINDPEKVSFLLEQAESHVPKLSPSFSGEMASYAYLDHRFIAKEIVKRCGEEQIAAAPPYLLEQFAMDRDWYALSTLVEKGISGGPSAARTLHMLTCQKSDRWIAEELLQKRMWVDTGNYDALHACIQNDAVEVCKLLLDGGMDFDGYRQWAEARHFSGHEETMQILSDYWSEIKAEMEQTGAPTEAQQSGFGGERSHSEMSELSPQAEASNMELVATIGGMTLANPMLLAKAAVAVLSDERTQKAAGWTVVAILSPLILLIAFLCALGSGTSEHNISAVELCFYGGSIPANTPAEYRACIEQMQTSFTQLDSVIAAINGQTEGEASLDDTRVKAIFYALYFGAETQPEIQSFADCFVTYEERTRTVTVKNDDGTTNETEETYTVAIPVEDLTQVYQNIHSVLGTEVTADQQGNADSIYNLIRYGYTEVGGNSFDGADVPFIGVDGFCSPIGANWRNVVTSEFGNRRDPITGERKGHTGMDLAVPTGTPIRAALAGTVTVAKYHSSYGNYVMIDHGSGLSTLYAHNSKLLVRVGQVVQAGDVVSLSGSTGRSTGPHLHFEVRVNGQRTNPRSYLP